MRQKGFTLIELMIATAIVFILVAVVVLPYFQCHAQAEKMGFGCEWSPVAGCMIESKPGKWIPLKRYRVMD